MCRDGDVLTGFLGFYGSGDTTELAGMVDPAARRHGIGTALLAAALPLLTARGVRRVLLVTPRSTPAGRSFAAARGATIEHSEHFLVLGATPAGRPADSRLTVRQARPDDAEKVVRILSEAFGSTPNGFAIRDSAGERTMVAERDGAVLATVRLTRDGAAGAIYGFAVDPPLQGRGIGRDVLTRVCRSLREDGAEWVTLEVATDNDRALDLYLSTGFRREATEDYFELAAGEHDNDPP
jgi:ribosomal protein S18 acetylase RimI-like enzyme